MKDLLENITKIFSKNNLTDLNGAVNEKKLLYLYCFYHYYYGDEDSLLDLSEHCPYSKSLNNFAQGFFEADTYDERTIDIIIPYFVDENNSFDMKKVNSMLSQTQNTLSQMQNNYYAMDNNLELLQSIWDPKSEDHLVLKVITNYAPQIDQANKIHDSFDKAMPLIQHLKYEIVFGNEIEEEISQLTSDKKCVENGELTLQKENNFLYYGEENSIITNVLASSIKDNFIKYGKSGLLAMNLRFYVSNKKVDEGLENSIKNNGENFWYYNNGIIIICDDFNVVGNKIKLHNYSIINGGQTTRMIGVIPFKKDFAVSCKIIKNKYKDDVSQSIKFISDIAEASNTQKPINATDLIANRYEQRLLKSKLSKEGIFVQIKRGDTAFANLSENYPEPWQKTKNDELGQLIYATICQKPGTARNSKSQIFSDKNKYKKIFGEIDSLDTNWIKDQLFLKAAYKKWSAIISKDENLGNDQKKGLVRNGYFFFLATISLITKFAYSNGLIEKLKTFGLGSQNSLYLLSFRTFNHKIFANNNYKDMFKQTYKLFDFIYEKYIERAFSQLKSIKPDIVYSNFTKTDINYVTYIIPLVFDDFYPDPTNRINKEVLPLLYTEQQIDKEDNEKMLNKALDSLNNPSEQKLEIDYKNIELKDALTNFRESEAKSKNINPSAILTLKEINNLVELKPQTVADILQLGCLVSKQKSKTKMYGDKIIEIIKGKTSDNN